MGWSLFLEIDTGFLLGGRLTVDCIRSINYERIVVFHICPFTGPESCPSSQLSRLVVSYLTVGFLIHYVLPCWLLMFLWMETSVLTTTYVSSLQFLPQDFLLTTHRDLASAPPSHSNKKKSELPNKRPSRLVPRGCHSSSSHYHQVLKTSLPALNCWHLEVYSTPVSILFKCLSSACCFHIRMLIQGSRGNSFGC